LEPIHTKINKYLQVFSQSHSSCFTLERGVCAICDEQGDLVMVLEVPPNSDVLILHSHISTLSNIKDSAVYSTLLTMNFNVSDMKGTWFSLRNNQVYLLTQRKIEDLDEITFSHYLNGFILHTKEIMQKTIDSFNKESLSTTEYTPTQWERFV